MLQLEPYLDRRPAELSGGQRQRVAIGRALVRKPEVFLFDEPLSNLDAKLRVQMRLELAKLHAALGATMIYVTHDQTEAMTLADKIVVLDGGRVAQVGAPLELYNHPANKFVAAFIGSPSMNFFSVGVASVEGGAATVALPGGRTARVGVSVKRRRDRRARRSRRAARAFGDRRRARSERGAYRNDRHRRASRQRNLGLCRYAGRTAHRRSVRDPRRSKAETWSA
jgi:ABC-type sugar transport system ATPase subunit